MMKSLCGLAQRGGVKLAAGQASGTRPTSVRFFSAGSSERVWKVYLSGEIHSDWRNVIAEGVKDHNLPVQLSSPNTSHEDSDDCGM